MKSTPTDKTNLNPNLDEELALVNKLIQSPKALSLGGEKKEISIFFSDTSVTLYASSVEHILNDCWILLATLICIVVVSGLESPTYSDSLTVRRRLGIFS